MPTIPSTRLTGFANAIATSPLQPVMPFARNPKLAGLLDRMVQEAQQQACEVVLLPTADTRVTTHYYEYENHTGIPKQMNVEDAPRDGILKFTLCINVSGHNGPQPRDDWAASNRYNVRVTLPGDPTNPKDRPVVLEMRDVQRNKPATREYATAIDIAIPTERWKYGPIKVQAWPTGTSPEGYNEGRTYELHRPGAPFNAAAAAEPPDGIDEEFWGLRS